MPLISDTRTRRKAGEGWVQDLQHMADELAGLKYKEAQQIEANAGLPWGSSKINTKDALARADEYEAPHDLSQWTDAQLVKAAVDAVKMREHAWTSGQWSPQTAATPHPQAAPAPVMAAAEAPAPQSPPEPVQSNFGPPPSVPGNPPAPAL